MDSSRRWAAAAAQPRTRMQCPPPLVAPHLHQHIIRLHALEDHVQHLRERRLGRGLVGLAVAHQEDAVARAHSRQQRLQGGHRVEGASLMRLLPTGCSMRPWAPWRVPALAPSPVVHCPKELAPVPTRSTGRAAHGPHLAVHGEGGGGGGRQQALEHLQLHALIRDALAAAHEGNGLRLGRVHAQLGRAHAIRTCRAGVGVGVGVGGAALVWKQRACMACMLDARMRTVRVACLMHACVRVLACMHACLHAYRACACALRARAPASSASLALVAPMSTAYTAPCRKLKATSFCRQSRATSVMAALPASTACCMRATTRAQEASPSAVAVRGASL